MSLKITNEVLESNVRKVSLHAKVKNTGSKTTWNIRKKRSSGKHKFKYSGNYAITTPQKDSGSKYILSGWIDCAEVKVYLI